MMVDYYDIANWKDGSALFETTVLNKTPPDAPREKRSSSHVRWRVELPTVGPVYAYALLTEFIAPQPNGMYTFLIEGLPVDNLIWWDFNLCCGELLVTVLSGVNGMEAHLWNAPATFDPKRFILQNTSRYRERIAERIRLFERHEVHANPYWTHVAAMRWIEDELATLAVDDRAIDRVKWSAKDTSSLVTFHTEALRYQVLSRSLVVTSAFSCEALVNTLLRIGAHRHVHAAEDRESALRPLLRSSLSAKLAFIHVHTALFKAPLALEDARVKAALELMRKRNDLAHSEPANELRLPDVYFDGYFPLYGGGPRGGIVDNIVRTYLVDRRLDAAGAARAARDFHEYMLGCVRSECQSSLRMQVEQPQLAYNTRKRCYSVVYPTDWVQFTMEAERGSPIVEDVASPPVPPGGAVQPGTMPDENTGVGMSAPSAPVKPDP